MAAMHVTNPPWRRALPELPLPAAHVLAARAGLTVRRGSMASRRAGWQAMRARVIPAAVCALPMVAAWIACSSGALAADPARLAATAGIGVAGFATLGLVGARRRHGATVATLTAVSRERDRIAADLAHAVDELRWTRTAVRDLRRSDPADQPAHPADHPAVDAAAGLAHELCGPLTGIVTRAELALEGMTQQDPGRTTLEAVRDDALRAATIARATLARSRGERSVAKLFDLGELAASVAEWHRAATGRAGIRFESSVLVQPRPLQDRRRASTTVMADPVAVEQILDNLVANSVAAMPHGGTVRVIVSAGPDRVDVRVIDDGAGMDGATLARAFDPYFTTRGAAGTGLGLAISRTLADAQGGSLTAVSTRGRGTTMTLRLPAAVGVPGSLAA